MRISKDSTGWLASGLEAGKARKSYGIALGFAALAAAAPSECTGPTNAPIVQVQCVAVNDFGYIASASGTLQITGRSVAGFDVGGPLSVNTHFIDDPSNVRTITLSGNVDVYGGAFEGTVLSGANDLDSVRFGFQNAFGSYVRSKSSIEYQTQCNTSLVRMPKVSDLVIDTIGNPKLHLENLFGGRIIAQVPVANVGNLAVTSTAIRTNFAGTDVMGVLFANAGSTSPANTLGPGEHGYIEIDLPAGSAGRCGGPYQVRIDVNQNVQSGPYNPFANDTGNVEAPCLRWTTPITKDALGLKNAAGVDQPPDPLIAFDTLSGIVSSLQVARADGNVCSVCHFPGSGRPYSPPAGGITPTLNIGGRTWAGAGGWANTFSGVSSKPTYLKQAFQRWLDDGAQ